MALIPGVVASGVSIPSSRTPDGAAGNHHLIAANLAP
jgi:hypothetical protein